MAAAHVCEHWPTPTVFTGYELGEVIRGERTLVAKTPPGNPVRVAYEVYKHPTGRHAWDETAIWYAVRGAEHDGVRYFDEVRGTNQVSRKNGANIFIEGPGTHAYLKKTLPDEDLLASSLDDLQTRPPALNGGK